MRRVCAENGVIYYRSDIIPCIHGFSTRIGGVSRLPHTRGLNLGFDRGDTPKTVLENLGLFADALGVAAESIISVSQIHSANVRVVDGNNRGEGFYKEELESCDGYVTDSQDITLGVRTADCVPILLYVPPVEPFGGAVAAVHAGWRGTALGIAREAVLKLCDMGASLNDIRVAIGPSIGSCCYTVKEDFYKSFSEMAGKALTDRYVTLVEDNIWVADLKGANRQILIDSGVFPDNIDVCDKCTCCNNEEFFSHRFSKGKRGTMLSVIVNTPKKEV